MNCTRCADPRVLSEGLCWDCYWDQACTNCGIRDLYAKGMCRPCYEYRRQFGRDRPKHVIERAQERAWRKLAAS